MGDKHRLGALPARPPTPPRPSSSHAVPSSTDVPQMSNPPEKTSVTNGQSSPFEFSPHLLSEGGSKRVNFSPLTSYIKAPEFSTSIVQAQPPLKSLRPSNQCKPTKSILKSRANIETPDEPPSSPTGDLPGMLESVMQQLAGDCRISRTDSYTQLLGSLSAYSDLPDTASLIDNMPLLIRYIRRDISPTSESFKPIEISLVHQASSLLCLLLWKPILAASIPDDFRHFVLDLAISSLQNPATPKSIVIDDMRILSIQNFAPKILTSAKAVLLLQTLRNITARFNGKSIISMRLNIYRKLVQQAPSVMVAHPNLWIDHIIQGMYNKVKDIRKAAIGLGLFISTSIGPNASISKALEDIFNMDMENGGKFIGEQTKRLVNMVANKDGSVYVPQIWSVVLLLLRKPRSSLKEWSHLKQWIMVIQTCFNCSDTATKLQAMAAWDRLIYAVRTNEVPGKENGKEMMSFLSKPIFLQLERKRDDTPASIVDQTISSYFNLLYYTFRPSTSYERLDSCWDDYVSSPFQDYWNSNPQNIQVACKILAELFWSSNARIWDEKRVFTKPCKLQPDDLPRLDCRWVRSRISKILSIFESFFKGADWGTGAPSQTPIGIAWINLLKSLADASSKEIQPSSDLMKSIAALLDLFQRLWKHGPGSLNVHGVNDFDIFLNRFHFLLTTMISTLESFPFTEKQLLKTTQETFQPAQTPTHRRPQNGGTIRSPILHLFCLLISSPPSSSSVEYGQLVTNLVQVGISASSSRGSQLGMLLQFAEIIGESQNDGTEATSDCAQEAWKIVSATANKVLTVTDMGTPSKEREDVVINGFHKTSSILELGVKFSGAVKEWGELFNSLVAAIRSEKGDFVLSAVIEKLSDRCFQEKILSIPRVLKIVEALVFPVQHTKHLPKFASALPNLKNQTSQQISCEKSLLLINRGLHDVYTKYDDTEKTEIVSLFGSLSSSLDRSPVEFLLTFLGKIQDGLSLWVCDASGKYGGDKRVSSAARTLISNTLRALHSTGNCNSATLEQLTVLISSGFETRHKSTVNNFIREWNSTFGMQEALLYPPRLEAALKRLRSFTNITLPNWTHTQDKEPSQPDFVSSSEESPRARTPLRPNSRHNRVEKRASGSPSLIVTPSSSRKTNRHKRNTPTSKNKTRTPETRVRHDDSQIQFVPVESSPTSGTTLESQLLTERQKDVRERQRQENNTIFSAATPIPGSVTRKIRISPTPTSTDPLTPILTAEPTSHDDDFAFSSPTPGSKGSNAQEFSDFSLQSLPPNFEWSPTLKTSTVATPSKAQKRKTPKKSASIGGQKDVPNSSSSDVENKNVALGPTPTDEPKAVIEVQSSGCAPQPLSKVNSGDKAQREQGQLQTDLPPAAPQSPQPDNSTPMVSDEVDPITVDSEENVDLVPDSFELQIASQLERDLELSVNHDEVVNRVSKRSSATGKRKRPDVDQSQNNRGTKIPRNHGVAVEIESPELQQAEAGSRRQSSSPASDQQSNLKGSKSTKSAPTKKALKNTGPKLPSAQVGSQRRSLRLRGEPAVAEAEPSVESLGSESSAEGSEPEFATAPVNPDMEDKASGHGDQQRFTLDPVSNVDSEPIDANSSILASLQSVLQTMKGATFGKTFLREIDDVMFEIKMEAHAAMRRHDE